jgi:transposase
MKRFIEGEDRSQSTLFPEHLDDYIAEDNPVRVIDVFVDELDLKGVGFDGMEPEVTGRPGYHPASLLKIYIYGYLNRIQSSRRLERETQRNVELIWLTGRLQPDFKTIADFRKDNGKTIRGVCREFIIMCRDLKLFSEAIVAIDGSKFKAVNNRDKNFTERKLKARMQQLDESIARYMTELDRADRDPVLVTEARVEHIKQKVETVREQMRLLKQIGKQMAQAPDGQISLTDPRRALDGHQRPRHRHGRIQRTDCEPTFIGDQGLLTPHPSNQQVAAPVGVQSARRFTGIPICDGCQASNLVLHHVGWICSDSRWRRLCTSVTKKTWPSRR